MTEDTQTVAAGQLRAVSHTPGPWEVIGGNIYACCPSILRAADKIPDGMRKSGDTLVVARVHAPERFRDGNALAVVEANARLIAATPDLLEALKKLFASYKDLGDSGDAGFWSLEETEVGQLALAALTKAQGLSPESEEA